MDFLHSLYDALVSVNVPNDKARAVVDAMERDMDTSLATRTDLQAFKQDVRQEFALVRKDLELVEKNLTIRLGMIVTIGLGVLFGALKLT